MQELEREGARSFDLPAPLLRLKHWKLSNIAETSKVIKMSKAITASKAIMA